LSTITLISTARSSNLKEISKPKKITSESHEYRSIIGITCLIFAVVFVLGIIGPIIYSYYGGTTALGLDEKASCAQKIHEYEQKGYYTSGTQVEAAMSFCYPK
jgi:hypothetical protein